MNHLNENQRKAVTHQFGPIMVIAGAGTGKTRVITERIAHMIKEGWADSDEILALTFTDKAAQEMEERLDVMMPIGYSEVQLNTFHRFCDRLLRRYGVDIGIPTSYRILQGVRHWQLIRDHLFDFDLDYYRPMGNPTKFIDALTSHFSRLKEELISPEDYLKWAEKKMGESEEEEGQLEAKKYIELASAYGFYQKLLIKEGYLDFSDLQYFAIMLLKKRPNILSYLQKKYKYILVDEYQDTNIAQNFMVDLLSKKHKNLMVVGDDDQSIYKFRGAAVSNILQFEKNYPDLKKVVLNQNYRSNQAILDAAYHSIQNNNPDRLEIQSGVNKYLTGQTPGSGQSVKVIHCSTLNEEVDYVLEEIKKFNGSLGDIAILGRSNSALHPYIEVLKQNNIAYQFPSEKGLYDKKEIMDLIALLRVIANPMDDISFYRVLRIPLWNIKMESIIRLIQSAKSGYRRLWTEIKNSSDCEFLSRTILELIDYSKTHTVGEVLYQFVEKIELYEKLVRVGTIEAEEQITHIAHFFKKIKDFEKESKEKTVVDFVTYLNLAEEAGENPSARFEVEGRDGVQVSTVHASKGLEFEMVFVVGMTNRRFPSDNRADLIQMPDELIAETLSDRNVHLQEERRLFYVAVTRAKNKLHLLHSDFYNPTTSTKPRKQKKSIFLEELEGKVDFTAVEKTSSKIEEFLRPKVEIDPSDVIQPSSDSKKITTFSYSQLSTFDRCPRQYQYQYIYKIPSPPNANLTYGSTLHNTLQEFYKLIDKSKQASLFEDYAPDLSLENLLNIYENKWLDQGYESREHMQKRKQRGREVLTDFYEKFKDNLPNVKYLEKGFKLRVGDYVLSGRVDRADLNSDGSLEIIDYKSGLSKSQKKVDNDLQLMIYAMAASDCFGIPATVLTLYFLEDNTPVSTVPTDKKIEKAKSEIKRMADQVNEGDFSPKPSKIICQYCPYRKICDSAC